MLARRSEIFRDMFAMPLPREGSSNTSQQMIDGVPAITLTDDPNDLTHLLDLVLPIASPYKPLESPSFESLSATLMLATKYCFDDLREWALSHVLHRFPHTLDEIATHPNLSVYKDPVIAARLINLARTADLPQLLPMAFYALVSYNWAGNHKLHQEAIGQLSLEDQARLTIGHLKMQDDVLARATKMQENGMAGSKCEQTTTTGSGCANGKPLNIWGDMVERLQSFVRDPIRECGIRMASKGQYYTLCSSCDDAIVAGSETARRELFEMLPTLFNL